MLFRKIIEQTREDFERIVRQPGKFEGQEPWAPYFYEQMLNGDGEYLNDSMQLMEILPEDKEKFPELEGKDYVLLYLSNDGFVDAKALSSKEAEEVRQEFSEGDE